MLKLTPLHEPAPQYAALTYPRFAPLLDRTVATAAGPLAIGATIEGTPAGLALLAPPFPNRSRRLLSIFVNPSYRRLGIAGRLLQEAEFEAAHHGTVSLHALHSTRLKSGATFEALLRRNGWRTPVEVEFRLTAEAGAYKKALVDWASLLTRLRRDGFRTVDWDTITRADLSEIAAIRENGELLAREFDPLNPEMQQQMLPMASVLLKRGNAVAGWVTATRGIEPGVCHYSNGYVVPSLRNRGWLIAAMCVVCERQALAFGPKSLAVFETSPDNIRMRRLMERGLAPYSLWTDIRYRSEKSLATRTEPASR